MSKFKKGDDVCIKGTDTWGKCDNRIWTITKIENGVVEMFTPSSHGVSSRTILESSLVSAREWVNPYA